MFTDRAELNWLSAEEKQVDRGVVAGIAISFVLIGLGVVFTGQGLKFLDLPAIFIVIGGTFGATLVHFPLYDILRAREAFREIFFLKQYHPSERIRYLVDMAQAVRQNGLLVLEDETKRTDDPFLKLALELTVDGQQEDDIKRVLETEMRTSNDRAARAFQVFQTMGNYAPAMGLIGTLIGLIQMLGSLDNPSTVGPAMSVALITTLYGAVLANLVFLPIAGKLKNRSEEECLVKAISIEGVIALGKQENPIVVEQRLQSFLPLKA